MIRQLKKTVIAVIVSILGITAVIGFYEVHKRGYADKIYCMIYGHSWERCLSDDWVWAYSYGRISEDLPLGYKYRYKPNYVICRRSGTYLFNIPVVETEVHNITDEEFRAKPGALYPADYSELDLIREWSYRNNKR